MNDTIEDNDHLWPNFETACRVISADLADITLYKIYGGCPKTCAGDVFLASAIMSAKRILSHLMEAQARRDNFIAKHAALKKELNI